jgi:hypothetical protein
MISLQSTGDNARSNTNDAHTQMMLSSRQRARIRRRAQTAAVRRAHTAQIAPPHSPPHDTRLRGVVLLHDQHRWRDVRPRESPRRECEVARRGV